MTMQSGKIQPAELEGQLQSMRKERVRLQALALFLLLLNIAGLVFYLLSQRPL
jgi:hypothetical protein